MRATNWVGDAVMSLPALRALRERFPDARDLDSRQAVGCRSVPPRAVLRPHDSLYARPTLHRNGARRAIFGRFDFDCAILLQNAFEAAAVAFAARIPERIGYARDGRAPLLTHAVAVPRRGEIPRHERFYYLELLRRAGIIDTMPENDFDPSRRRGRRARSRHARASRARHGRRW